MSIITPQRELMDVDEEDVDADSQQLGQEELLESVGTYPGIHNHIAMPFHTFSVKRGGKQVQAILSASWMQKQLI